MGVVEVEAIKLLIDGLKPLRRTRIVDVGANPLDAPPYRPLLDLGYCDIVGFEPQVDAFEKLAATKSERETYLPYAVGDGTRKTLNLYRNSGFTSVYPLAPKAMAMLGWNGALNLNGTADVDTVTLDSLSDLGDIDMLKIDVQGSEYDIFRYGSETLANAVAVITEIRFFPIYGGEPMSLCDQELRRQGFELHKLLFAKSRPLQSSQAHRLNPRFSADQLVDGDGVYLRDISRLDSYSEEKLKHLCILASSCFNSHSLVLHILDLMAASGWADAELSRKYVDALSPGLKVGKELAQA